MMFAGVTSLLVILFIAQIIAIERHRPGDHQNLKTSISQQGSATTSTNTSRLTATSPTSSTGRSRTLHIIQCLSGHDPYFIDEWEIGFKSILVNAPLDSNLHVHLIADNNAAAAINERIVNSKMENSVWRNEISVILHNVDEMLPSWRLFLTDALTSETSSRMWMDDRVGIGGYLRLLAHRVVVPYECGPGCADFEKRDLEQALYADTDVVIIGNLNHLMYTTAKVLEQTKQEGKGRPLWIWNQNSGFLIMDLMQFERVWELAATIPNVIKNSEEKMKGDQWLLAKVQDNLRSQNTTAIMPEQWSTHTGHGFRRFPQNLYIKRKQGTGMLHFTMPSSFGKSWLDMGGTDKWCKSSRSCNESAVEPGGDMDKVRRTWGLAEYYAKLSWEWAIYQGGTSRLRPGERNTLKYIKRKWHPDSDKNKPPIQQQYSLKESKQLDQEDLIELSNFCGDNKWKGTQISCEERAQYLVSSYQMSEQNAKILILENGCKCSVLDMPRV